MKRRVFAILAAISLLLCLATVAFWISGATWSLTSLAKERRPVDGTRVGFVLGQGAVIVQVVRPGEDRTYEDVVLNRFLGFAYVRAVAYASGFPLQRLGLMDAVFVPFWFVALLSAVLPAWWAAPRVRAKLVTPEGHCRGCGYDLRATPERCPECGRLA